MSTSPVCKFVPGYIPIICFGRGAGIVGTTLAVALNALDKDQKITIDIYEAAPELGEIGAGINVWPRTWELFKKIGLGDTLVPLFDHHPDLEPRTFGHNSSHVS